MKSMIKLGLILAAYAAAACVLLAMVNNVTAPVIAAAKAQEETAGLAVCFPLDTDGFEAAKDFEPQVSGSITVENLYLAKKGSAVIGAVVKATGRTYDKATILLGIDMNRTLTGIHFLSLTDTPGFGQRAAEPSFYEQFAGKSADDAYEAGSDVDMITGATITTRGVAQLVKYAAYIAAEYLAEHSGGAAGSGNAPVITEAPSVFTYDTACSSLFPDAVFTEITESADSAEGYTIEKRYTAHTVDGTVIGTLVSVRGPAFNGTGVTLTGVDMNGIITGVRIIELNDTPGLGQRALEESFYGQFAGKPAEAALAVPSDIDAISGATVTSAYIADMVRVGAAEAVKLAIRNGAALTVSDTHSATTPAL